MKNEDLIYGIDNGFVNNENYFKKIFPYIKDEYVGTVPLDLMVFSLNMTASNCLRTSLWLAFSMKEKVDGEFVEGETGFYKTVSSSKYTKSKYAGYHVWLEIDGKVYDPILMSEVDKDYYYEKMQVSKTEKVAFKDLSENRVCIVPTNKAPTDEFDIYRQSGMICSMRDIIEAESYIYEDKLKEGLKKYIEKNEIKEKRNKLIDILGIDGKTQKVKSEAIAKVFKDKKKYPGEFIKDQYNMMGMIGRQRQILQEFGVLKLETNEEAE